MTREEAALTERFRALDRYPRDQFMTGFARLQLAPGVVPPPPPQGPPPAWMAKRPAGIRAFLEAFDKGNLDAAALQAFDRPVYFALGGRSNPDYFGRMAERLAATFPDFTIETFPERHHFDPPHRVEPEHLANSLLGSGTAPSRRPVIRAACLTGSPSRDIPAHSRTRRTHLRRLYDSRAPWISLLRS